MPCDGLGSSCYGVGKYLEHSASQERVGESNYLLFNEETLALKQRLVLGVSCDEEMEQRFINSSMNLLMHLDALHSNAGEAQNTVMASSCGSLASLVQRVWSLFLQGVPAVSRSVDSSVCKAFVELRGSIFECEAATKGRFEKSVSSALPLQEQIPPPLRQVGQEERVEGGGGLGVEWGRRGSVEVVDVMPTVVCTGRSFVRK